MLNLLILNEKKLCQIMNVGMKKSSDYGLSLMENVAVMESGNSDERWIITEDLNDPFPLIEHFNDYDVCLFIDCGIFPCNSIFKYHNRVVEFMNRLKESKVHFCSYMVVPEFVWSYSRTSSRLDGYFLDTKALWESMNVRAGEFSGVSIGTMLLDVSSPDVPDVFNGIEDIGYLEIRVPCHSSLQKVMLQFLFSNTLVRSCRILFEDERGEDCLIYSGALRREMFRRYVHECFVFPHGFAKGSEINPLLTEDEFNKWDWESDPFYVKKMDNIFYVEKMDKKKISNSGFFFRISPAGIQDGCGVALSPSHVAVFAFYMWSNSPRAIFKFARKPDDLNSGDDASRKIFKRMATLSYVRPFHVDEEKELIDSEFQFLNQYLSHLYGSGKQAFSHAVANSSRRIMVSFDLKEDFLLFKERFRLDGFAYVEYADDEAGIYKLICFKN